MQVKLTNEMFIRIVAAGQVVIDALIAVIGWSWRFLVLVASMALFLSAIVETRVLLTGTESSYYGTTDPVRGIVIIVTSAVASVLLFVMLMNSEPDSELRDLQEVTL